MLAVFQLANQVLLSHYFRDRDVGQQIQVSNAALSLVYICISHSILLEDENDHFKNLTLIEMIQYFG